MIRMLDHVVLVARDLDTAVADHRRRGFTVTPGGKHADGLTHNALVPFADGSYLEIVAFPDLDRAVSHRWWKIAAEGGGFADFALLSDDLGADTLALKEIVTRSSATGGRTRPDGIRLEWRTAILSAPLPFIIQDLTSRELRVPQGAAAQHANGAGGIAKVILGAKELADAEWRYARLRERGAPEIELRADERDAVLDVRFKGD
ncbi:MAG: VOC family protein [Chloroflexi bacterium]|nr:MAG: VOC family protein [Chloroflexota bacterium]